ncbi:MAG: CsgG/HfaB family protein, partial [Sediminispirochaetaceae bacterium]
MSRTLYRRVWAGVILLCMVVPVVSAAEADINVAVVEFEEKNSIGLENAGRIVAEWTVTEMKKIGKFQIQERLLMNKVLEEQNLMLSGVIDSSQAVEIGQLYGVEAI